MNRLADRWRIILLAALIGFGPLPAGAAQFNVNTDDDSVGDSTTQDNICDTRNNPFTTPPIPASNICTLRAAIEQANATPGKDTIFIMVQTIRLTRPLPPITDPVIVQRGLTTKVTLDGANAGPSARGLAITSGSTEVRGLIIINFNGAGIEISGSGGNKIDGNYIGVNDTGNTKAPNGIGIIISNSPNNLIGGATANTPNLISGNTAAGIFIFGDAARTNRVLGNFIGVDSTGAQKLANGGSGISIERAPFTSVGGASVPERNVISGNDRDGIDVVAAPNTSILGNFIGVNATGSAGLGNGGVGVQLVNASQAILGAGGTPTRNVISSNGGQGIAISGALASDNIVEGNFIGTDAAGTAALPNGRGGILISGGPRNRIGGPTPPTRNIISGNSGNGLAIQNATASGNEVQNNYIGVKVNGTEALANTDSGVVISDAPSNTIGGVTVTLRNIISGNLKNGVVIQGAASTGNKVQGNHIGVNNDGTAALSNLVNGVLISGAPANLIGGVNSPTSQPRNVISGNGKCGIEIDLAAADGNQAQGNYIGLNANGDTALPNGLIPPPGQVAGGIFISGAPNTLIGGPSEGARNLISGNNGSGVVVSGGTAARTKIHGNFIGTDKGGTQNLGNWAAGVFISEAPDTQVGDATPTPGTPPGNLISANNRAPGSLAAGVHIQGAGATGSLVRGNLIGTQKDGTSALPNTKDGVFIALSASNNTIGGLQANEGNRIAFNGRAGVIVDSGTGNGILSNSIFRNQSLGIDLNTDGVTFNDSTTHTGANLDQNFPALLSSKVGGPAKLFAKPSTAYTVQIFANSTADPSGFGQGEKLLQTLTVTTDPKGVGDFVIPTYPAGQVLSATATDPSRNTSEFSCAPFQKIPLGGSQTASSPGCFKVYVPSKWGGKLLVGATTGTVSSLKAPDGTAYVSGAETGTEKHGWYLFAVTGSTSYTVSNTFVEDGTTVTVPWNFWYFPFLPGGSLRMYDTPGPYTKFDTKFSLGTASFDWENTNHKRPSAASWEGHCWGAALASIILKQPIAAGAFTVDDLEGLAADFFDEVGATQLAPSPAGTPFPFAKPTAAATDPLDKTVHEFHNTLREMLRSKKKAFHINLRQARGVGTEEVWNQGCYKYSSELKEDSAAAGDGETEKILQIAHKTNFICNEDFLDPSNVSVDDPASNPRWRREQESEYILIYRADGEIVPNGTLAGRKQNWLTMKLIHDKRGDVTPPVDVFVPKRMFDVTTAAGKFAGTTSSANAELRADRLITLGLAKH